jgi:hypothetical protein
MAYEDAVKWDIDTPEFFTGTDLAPSSGKSIGQRFNTDESSVRERRSALRR